MDLNKTEATTKKFKADRPHEEDLYSSYPQDLDASLDSYHSPTRHTTIATPNTKKRPLDDPKQRNDDEDDSDIDLDLARELLELDGGDIPQVSPVKSDINLRDSRDSRDNRDNRDINIRDSRDSSRDNRDFNPRDNRDFSRDNRDNTNRDNRDFNPRDSRDFGRDNRDNTNRDNRDFNIRDSRDFGRDNRDNTNRDNTNRDNRDKREYTKERDNRDSRERSLHKEETPSFERVRVNDENCTDLAVSQISNNNFPKVQLLVNQFLTTFNNRTILQHNVEFDPKQENRKQRNKLITSLMIPVAHKYDGSSILYSLDKINEINFIENVKITISKVAEYSNTSKQSTQFFNILIKKIIRDLKFVQIGRQYYDPRSKVTIPNGTLEVWSGYFTSVGHIQAGTSLLCDVSHKIVRTTSILDKIYQMEQNRCRPQQIENELQGNIVITKYNNKTYRISRIAFEKKLTDRISDDNPITFKEYYNNTYPKSIIRDLKQPLLEVQVKRFGTTQKIYLVPELSFATGIDDDTSKNFHIMKEIANHKHKDPKDRFNSISGFIHTMDNNKAIKEEMNKWQVSIQPAMTVQGGVIPKPERDMKKGLLKGLSWSILAKADDRRKAETLAELLNRTYAIPKPEIYELHGDRFNLNNEISSKLKALKGQKQDLVLIVLPNPSIYTVVKQESLIKYGIVTQCIKPKTLESRNLHSIAEKLVHQMTAKIGKAPWVLSGKMSCPPNTMVIGIDVGHNQDQKGKSVIGFVASLDSDFSLYHSVPSVQTISGKEIISSLRPAIKSSLHAYHKRNRVLPSTVIIYRDGVGDGMLQQVRTQEVTCIKESFQEMADQLRCPKPSLMYIIVKKNTNTRFVTKDRQDNPVPGTVVDSKCTHQDWYDFFLVSQRAMRGSVNPTHYHVIYDDAKMTAPDLQMFTYYLTYLYFNFDSSVSVPAPTQFAHKLAFLIGRSVYQNVNEDVSSKLYFL